MFTYSLSPLVMRAPFEGAFQFRAWLAGFYFGGFNMAFWGCKWCGGRGCLSCDVESDRAYKAAFPDGPKPICTIATDGKSAKEIGDELGKAVGAETGAAIAEALYGHREVKAENTAKANIKSEAGK